MQDYFKYDKIQGGSSLFMKSDSDGEKDKDKRALPLGIKTNAQGIKSFTNWDEISNSIDRRGKLSFDDHQATSLKWFSEAHDREGNYIGASFNDEWEASDINIIDDLAFVSYEKYTDINREDIQINQPLLQSFAKDKYYNYVENYESTDVEISEQISKVAGYFFVLGSENSFINNFSQELSPANACDMSNCIIKLEISDKTLYFRFGGIKQSHAPYQSYLCSRNSNNGTLSCNVSYTYENLQNTGAIALPIGIDYSNINTVADGYEGKFYVVKPSSAFGEFGGGGILIQLDVGQYTINSYDPIIQSYLYRKVLYENGDVESESEYIVLRNMSDITNIKISKIIPVRQCGKVDIYSRKMGIISSIIENRITSQNHNLNTNDIIKIENVMFDGNQTGPVDIHPLNGEKFIKKIDDDTFDLYDDQFFEKPSSTKNIKTTDGITWSCVGNAVGGIGSAWDFYRTILSPTGRNGYIGNFENFTKTNDLISLTSPQLFLTKNRIKPFIQSDLNNVNGSKFGDSLTFPDYYINEYLNGASVYLNFQETPASNLTPTAGSLKKILDNIPVSTLGKSSFSKIQSAIEDFYPFSQDDSNYRYLGNMFGCSLSCIFSHYSGDSKIYILAIGEKGSDISIDFRGASEGIVWSTEFPEYRLSYRGRQYPQNLPYGKVHLFHVTVDRYGRISSILHKNTICGSGRSIVYGGDDTEKHPWDEWRIYLNNSSGTFVSYINVENSSILKSNTSHYWYRASIPNWFGVEIPDYHRGVLRKLDESKIIRGYILTNGASYGNDRSRFGTIGTDDDNFKFKRINRNDSLICPWFDSFGKSVTLGKSIIDGQEKILLFGGSSVVAKVESSFLAYVGTNTTDVFPKTISASHQISESETRQQIGQITGFIIDSNCVNSSFMEITSGGSNRNKVLNSYILSDGDEAGSGHKHVARSCHLSAQKIIFKNDLLIWANQRITDCVSTIHILKHQNGVFVPYTKTNKNFINHDTIDKTKGVIENIDYSGDGFGWDLHWNGNLLLTNALSSVNDFEENIESPLDSVFIYKYQGDHDISFVQQLSPTLNILNEKYTQSLIYKYANYLIPVNNVTYDNDAIGSYTWDIRLIGKYAIVGQDKIILKDPLEYTLFGRDYSVNISQSVEEFLPTDSTVRPYFYFSEYFKDDTVYYDYSAKTIFNIEDVTMWSKDATQLTNYRNIIKTPVFFLDIPQYTDSFYGDLKISIQLDSIGKRFANIKDINTLGNSLNQDLVNDSNYLVPKLILYSKDPRSTIVPNGFSYFPYRDNQFYQDQLVSYIRSLTNDNLIFKLLKEHVIIDNSNIAMAKDPALQPPLFRCGAHDMHYYASKLGSVASRILGYDQGLFYGGEINVGELYDISFGKPITNYYSGAVLNPLNEGLYSDRGIISWSARDNTMVRNGETDILPYAALISEYTSSNNTITYTLPYNTWSKYLIYGNLLKSPSNNRPMFNSFTRIKHGSIGPNISINDTRGLQIDGSWDYSYNDIAKQSYTPKIDFDNKIIAPQSTLAIGFILTSMYEIDLVNDDLTGDQFGNDALTNWRHIDETPIGDSAMSRWHHSNWSKYSYTPLISTSINNDTTAALYDRTRQNVISNEFISKINNIQCSVETKKLPERKFKNLFHKIAVFDYDQSEMYDVKKYSHGFSRYSFTPSTITTGYMSRNISMNKPQIESIVATSANNHGKIYIISSDSIMGESDFPIVAGNISELYVENDSVHNTIKNGVNTVLGAAHFTPASLLGAFEIDAPNYLSLTIFSNEMSFGNSDLSTVGATPISGDLQLITRGIDSADFNNTLWIGQRLKNTGIPLNISGPDRNRFLTLQIDEIKPSGNITLNIGGPDIYNNFTLTFAPINTGVVPLYIQGPTQKTQSIALHTTGRSNFAKNIHLFTSGIGRSSYFAPLYINAKDTSDNSISLVMNIPNSGSFSLWTSAPIPTNTQAELQIDSFDILNNGVSMHIGTLYDVHNNNATLMTKSQFNYVNNTSLYVEGKNPSIANSLQNNIDAPTILARNADILDISHRAELPVILSFDNIKSRSNSILRKNISFDEYRQIYSTSNGYGNESSNLLHYTNDLRYLHFAGLPSARSKNIAAYKDKKYGFINNIDAIRKPLISNNLSKAVIASSKQVAGPSIQIYDIINEKFNFNSEISGTLINISSIISDSVLNSWNINGSSQFPLGDSFAFIANLIYNLDPIGPCKNYQILDIAISDVNKCAISIKLLKYNSLQQLNSGTISHYYNLIIIADLNKIKTNGQIKYLNREDIVIKITSEGYHSAASDFTTSYGDCIEFIYEDLYVSARTQNKEGIIIINKDNNYSSNIPSLENEVYDFDFDLTNDSLDYINNLPFIDTKITGFGRKFKVFNDNGTKILIISAPLYDPYLKNTLSAFHETKPIGALYIYKKNSGSSAWAYFGAVYGKGNTSDNLISNIDDYTPSTVSNEYRYFGFDFDYKDGKLVVSQPGGEIENYSVGVLYLFKISDNIILEQIYRGSDISDISLNRDDIFGESVVLFDVNTPITTSTSNNGVGLVHNMKLLNTASNSYIYNQSDNLNSEWYGYEIPILNYYPLNTYYVGNKNLEFVSDIIKINNNLFINRIFEFDLNTLIGNTLYTKHYLPKIQLLNLQAEHGGFPLYISGPNLNSNNITMSAASKDLANSTTTLNIEAHEINTINTTLAISAPATLNMPLYVGAGIETDISLYINAPIPVELPLDRSLAMSIDAYGASNSQLALHTQGDPNTNATAVTSLFIGEDINLNYNMSLTTYGLFVSEGAEFLENHSSLCILARSSFGIDKSSTLFIEVPPSAYHEHSSTLFITTDIPSTGITSGYIQSGNINIAIDGNNDSLVFTEQNSNATLSIASASIFNSGEMPLYIERPIANSIPLLIRNQNPSEIITTSISGAYIETGSISLTVSPPTAGTIDISTRGFLE